MQIVKRIFLQPFPNEKIALLTKRLLARAEEFNSSDKQISDELREVLRDVDQMIMETRTELSAIKSTVEDEPEWRTKRWVPLIRSHLDAQSAQFDELERVQKQLLQRLEAQPRPNELPRQG